MNPAPAPSHKQLETKRYLCLYATVFVSVCSPLPSLAEEISLPHQLPHPRLLLALTLLPLLLLFHYLHLRRPPLRLLVLILPLLLALLLCQLQLQLLLPPP